MENYEVEFKVNGLSVCKPDTLLTGEMKFLRQNVEDGSFSILIAEQIEDPAGAIKTARNRLELYLDFYNLFFEQPLKILNDEDPISVSKVKDRKVVGGTISMNVTLGPLFIPTEIKKDSALVF